MEIIKIILLESIFFSCKQNMSKKYLHVNKYIKYFSSFKNVVKRMFKLMVNNSTNINKTNNHLSPQLIEYKKITTDEVGNLGPCLGQVKKCGGVKSLIGLVTYIYNIPPSPSPK